MTRFERVKQILDEAIEGQNIGAHGTFWRPLDLKQFKQKKIYGRRLVIPGDVASSNLVLALRGVAPFGTDVGTPNAVYPRMPVGFPRVPEERILFIEDWIRNGCPDDEWVPPSNVS
jgi:hypothetical protein